MMITYYYNFIFSIKLMMKLILQLFVRIDAYVDIFAFHICIAITIFLVHTTFRSLTIINERISLALH